VPSPVKLQPKVSYCKTYEQIRLEEIQAESAAYYSYESSNFGPYRNQEDVGKPKSINANHGNRWVCLKRSMDTQENAPQKMDFKVLTLEEIRQRKQEKELVAKADQPILTDIASQSPVSVVTRTKRRSNEILENSMDSVKKCKNASPEHGKSTDFTVIKGPVKLRRKTSKDVAAKESEMQSCKSTPMNETTNGSQNDEKACRERLESHGDKSTNMNRRSEVEVRMCDSSTMEQRTQTQPERETEDKKSVATYATSEDIVNSVLLNQPFTNTEEYLDASADDIMKDIEDLLK